MIVINFFGNEIILLQHFSLKLVGYKVNGVKSFS